MEDLMYYIWQQRMFQSIQTVNQTPLEILHPGFRNLDAGPDFFNAKIRIGGTLWAGNVEMHVRASDWFRHRHHSDPAYSNVILHVVLQADSEVRLSSGETVQTAVMQIPPDVLRHYRVLTAQTPYSFSAINCRTQLASVPPIVLHDWQSALAVERMLGKAKRVSDLIGDKQKSWPEALYVALARALGTSINSDACERLARSLPLAFLLKHLDQPRQIEALLLGQAGLIDRDDLAREYAFLRAKFSLTPLPPGTWRLARSRPQAAPQLRLRSLASLLCHRRNLFSDLLACRDVEALARLFSVPKLLGRTTVRSLIINAAVPILIAYAQWTADSELSQRALAFLESLPAESNRYMDYWKQCGIPLRNALDSQAMLQLYREYCEPHKCLRCRLGCWLIKHRPAASGNELPKT